MAIDLSRKTLVTDNFKYIATADPAIDWDATYPEMMSNTEAKKDRYRREFDLLALVMRAGQKPTLFVWKHPKRADVQKEFRVIWTRAMSLRVREDTFTEVFNFAF